MKILLRILITALLVLVIDYFMPGITVKDVTTSIIVAFVIGLLNTFIKPLLVLFTLPVTVFSLGLFLLIINAIIIILCQIIVGGFHVDSFWSAFLFSIFLTISQSIAYKLTSLKD